MLTRIVMTNERYKVGESFKFDGKTYTIHEIESAGDLTRLWLV